jgi:tetratricopeptide (TPR) repeat protein
MNNAAPFEHRPLEPLPAEASPLDTPPLTVRTLDSADGIAALPDRRLDRPTWEQVLGEAIGAERDGDADRALALWTELRTRFPQHPRGFVSGGIALKRKGRLDEAVALLAEGVTRFPDDLWLINEHAWAVYDRGDADADAVWQAVRVRYPDNPEGYVGGGLVHRQRGEFETADALYREGLARFEGHRGLLTDFAWSAEMRGDADESLRRWQAVRAAHPDHSQAAARCGVLLLARSRFDEADALLSEAVARCAPSEELLTAHAWAAHHRRHWPQALERWDALLRRYPEQRDPRRMAAQVLLEMGRYPEAGAVLAPALRLYPDDLELLVVQGWLTLRRGDAAVAEALWRGIRSRNPERPDGHLGLALALRAQQRLQEAEQVLGEARQLFPAHAVMAQDFADLAERRRDWPAAIERWRDAALHFPDLAEAPLGLARSLVAHGDAAAAQVAQADALTRFPDSPDTLAAHAEAAGSDNDWPAALERWTRFCDRYPDQPAGYQGRARALRDSGDVQGAVESLAAAAARFPDDVPIAVQWASTLSALRDWPRALELWQSLLERFPEQPAVRTGILESLGQAVADQGARGVSFQIPAALLEAYGADQSQAQGRHALLRRFESLGDSCEMGIVQRMYRVEHVSLLRWAQTSPPQLIEALKSRFAGVGDPEHTRVYVEGGEYVTHDDRYHMHTHTFVSPAIEPLDAFAPEQCRRIQWLRNRFLDGLGRGAKIYIYKFEDGIDDDCARTLHAALTDYHTKNVLVCVRLADENHPSGSAELLAPGLFAGYVERFSTIDIPVVAWLQVCEAVARHLDAR